MQVSDASHHKPKHRRLIMARKKTSTVSKQSKVFNKGKLKSLTFADLESLSKLLKSYKGTLPLGFRRRRGGQFCVGKGTH